MNSLSWFLYFVDISQAIAIVLWLFVASLFIAIIASWVRGSWLRDKAYNGNDDPDWKDGYLMQWNSLKLLIPIGIFIILACLVPSRQTLYMIAASQIGERVVALEEVQALGGDVGGLAADTITLLRQQIQSQITNPVPAKE